MTKNSNSKFDSIPSLLIISKFVAKMRKLFLFTRELSSKIPKFLCQQIAIWYEILRLSGYDGIAVAEAQDLLYNVFSMMEPK